MALDEPRLVVAVLRKTVWSGCQEAPLALEVVAEVLAAVVVAQAEPRGDARPDDATAAHSPWRSGSSGSSASQRVPGRERCDADLFLRAVVHGDAWDGKTSCGPPILMMQAS